MIQLSERAQSICESQGWDDQSLIYHLLGFIAEQVEDHRSKLEAYFERVKDEENHPEQPEEGLSVTFIGQGWMNNMAIPLDDSRAEFVVPFSEVMLLTGLAENELDRLEDEDELRDSLHCSMSAPRWVREWYGPFEIELEEDGK